jgi:hypothetical protein
VLLSDVDLRKELEAGRLVLDPWDRAMLRFSCVDVRLDSLLPRLQHCYQSRESTRCSSRPSVR